MPTPVTSNAKESWLNRPLAIVGMACRLPGADNLDEFWDLLISGGYAVTRMPDSKLNRDLYFHPDKGVRGKTYSDVGGFVRERELDWDILPIDRTSAGDWDECHLNLCEVAARACVHAGYNPRALEIRKTGVFIGHSGGSTLGGELAFNALSTDYASLVKEVPGPIPAKTLAEVERELLEQLRDGRPQRQEGKPHVEASYAAGLISHALGLNGPFMSIDAACASSLVALALGANALHSGQADMAIVGGASYNKTDSLILFSNAQSCSASASRPFDDNADGLISSEGYVCLVIKTLERAEADGDTIQAVVQGIGVSSDGRGRSLWAPRKEGQCTAIQRAYSERVRPDSVQLIEAHATSTQVGDATEMEALASFYQDHLPPGCRLPVGSVKSNIGHTLETAGLAGLVKSVLAIQHRTIPQTVNIENLSGSIPWSEIPLYAATKNEEWPKLPVGVPRRAAVNAFGIGGLNVHVVVDEYNASDSSSDAEQLLPAGKVQMRPPVGFLNERVAVVGRGVVLPGAFSIGDFEQLLQRPMSQLRMPPRDRVRTSSEHLVESGFITDFEYDWRKHKVPPKQISQANPLQFMLLDAAGQALEEAGLQQGDWDRAHTAVVVGSSFGGDFGNALFGGLRLPEIRWRLQRILQSKGIGESESQAWIEEYEKQFLHAYPAVLDETGSFTSSTLASRLTKTFDLMGGAMAIDAGDVSGLAALSTACGLLRSGSITHVLCAAAQRALDHSALQNLWQLERLPGSAKSARDGYSVGEGVALIVLKLERDAIRDGDRILATIDDVSAGFDPVHLSQGFVHSRERLRSGTKPGHLVGALGNKCLDREVAAALRETKLPLEKPKNLQATGHLQAVQGLVDVVTTSLQPADQNTNWVAGHSTAGQCYLASVAAGHASIDDSVSKAKVSSHTSSEVAPAFPSNEPLLANKTSVVPHVYQFEAASREELASVLVAAQTRDAKPEVHSNRWRAAVVCEPGDLPSKATRLASQLGVDSSVLPLAEQGMFWQKPSVKHGCKVAWLFPGQGSQYTGMLRELVAEDSVAKRACDEANEALRSMQQPSFEHLAWRENNSMGEDVWHTQASVLVANWILTETLRSRGFAPSLVAGHSFGEFSAMLAAGCWDIENALLATWHRCRSIVENVAPGCAMLSIHADQSVVRSLLTSSQLPLSISHLNAPEQTVVGGKQTAIAELAEIIEDRGLQSRILPVPTAFHTSSLKAATDPFLRALGSVKMGPPNVPLLSSVTNTYVADPDEIRRNLAQQLVEPLDFMSLVGRALRDGVDVFAEVGPQQILTRLARQIDEEIAIVPTNHAKRSDMFQLLCAQTSLELNGAHSTLARNVSAGRQSMRHEPVHYDATQPRRQRLRRGPLRPVSDLRAATAAALKSPVHFDATDVRREGRRLQSNQPESSVHNAAVSNPVPPVEPLVPSPARDNELSKETEKVAIERFLIDFVVEQTGYPAEIIELDWDIEADLGIDSIKKAQLFGELREFFDIESHRDLNLDTFKTLRSIVELLEQTPGKGDWLRHRADQDSATGDTQTPHQTDSQPVTPNPSDSHADFAAPRESSAGSQSSVETEPESQRNDAQKQEQGRATELIAFLVDFVVEQTGYPPEIVELDADLEADLGIDSIKKAQLLGEIREMFGMQVQLDQQRSASNQDEFKTLRSILSFLLEHMPGEASSNGEANPRVDPAVDRTESPAENEDHTQIRAERTVPVATVSGSTEQLSRSDENADDSTRQLGFDQFPSAFVDRSTEVLRCNAVFMSQAKQNLRALASRKADDEQQTASASNGHRNWYVEWIDRLAITIGVTAKSVENLDRSLHVKSRWGLCNGPSSVNRTYHGAEASGLKSPSESTVWLAELHLPTWLTELGYAPVAWIAEDRLGRLVVPGVASAFAVVRDDSTLLVGGLRNATEDSGHACLALSRFLSEHKSRSISELSREVRELNQVMNEDWWLMAVAGRSGEILCAESEDQCLVLENSSIDEWAKGNFITGEKTTSEQAAARIGWDPDQGKFVVWARAGTPLEKPVTLRIDESWFESEATSLDDWSSNVGSSDGLDASEEQETALPNTKDGVTSRYELRMVSAESSLDRSRVQGEPEFYGRAVVVGDNEVAKELVRRLQRQGVEVQCWSATNDPMGLAEQFDELAATGPVPHLFLTTPMDEDAIMTLDESVWLQRRSTGLMSNFWLCQHWLAHVIESDLTDAASLVAVTSLGGDFGLSGEIASAEGGGLAGLLKSMIIESWTQGYRPLTIKVLDTAPGQSPQEIVSNVWQELRIPTYDSEIAYENGQRKVIRAFATEARNQVPISPRRPSGVWVCTGGARGITAYVAEQLGRRFGLTLHLLGKSPEPSIDPAWRDLDKDGTRRLKAHVMTTARDAGQNPVKTWQNTEKAIEIDATLRSFRNQGIEAFYHSCDVSDRTSVRSALRHVREISGPISGVLHGAGVGKDSRFDRKQPEKVDECIAAKVDGALALMEATQSDPLEFFIGFGSISGRFGANGHTDYSLANEMLCKQIDWFSRQRPDVRAFGFHWHAWGDVGMATKPETRLALEMIDMQFMPAVEGLQHLINEIQAPSGPSEILVTDDRYFRSFYPAETVVDQPSEVAQALSNRPLLDREVLPQCKGDTAYALEVDPASDPFLAEHLLDGRPLLPFVIATEMFHEAARQSLNCEEVQLLDIEATGAIRFFSDTPQVLRIETNLESDREDRVALQLLSDFVSRGGRVIESNRVNFHATGIRTEGLSCAEAVEHSSGISRTTRIHGGQALLAWKKPIYPDHESKFYVGWPLQRLRKFQLLEDGIVGRISAPALIELAGNKRSVRGWRVPSAAMDACLFTVGILAWQRVAPGSALPVRIGALQVGRLPDPGEACEVHAKLVSTGEGKASFDFTLYGVDGSVLLNALDYEVAWILSGESTHQLENDASSGT